jgi:hypothetical protein
VNGWLLHRTWRSSASGLAAFGAVIWLLILGSAVSQVWPARPPVTRPHGHAANRGSSALVRERRRSGATVRPRLGLPVTVTRPAPNELR